MAVSVTHSKVSGKSNPADGSIVGGEDWDDEHVVSGIPFTPLIGSTVRIPVLIESKTLSAGTTTTTFSSLNGDSDLEYLLLFDLTLASASGDHQLNLYFNSDTGSNYDRVNHGVLDSTHGVGEDTQTFITYQRSSETTYTSGKVEIQAKTGKQRTYSSDYIFNAGTYNRVYNNTIWWSNTANNLTSIVLTMQSGSSMSGTIKLYKMIDLTL